MRDRTIRVQTNGGIVKTFVEVAILAIDNSSMVERP